MKQIVGFRTFVLLSSSAALTLVGCGSGPESIDESPQSTRSPVKSSRTERSYWRVRPKGQVTTASRRELEGRGVRLLQPLNGGWWAASSAEGMSLGDLVALVDDPESFTRSDRTASDLGALGHGPLIVAASFHRDVSEESIRALLRALGLRGAPKLSLQGWFIEGEGRAISRLLDEPQVLSVRTADHVVPHSWRNRAAIGADIPQGFTVSQGQAAFSGVSGKGVVVGVFDTVIDDTATDLQDLETGQSRVLNPAPHPFSGVDPEGYVNPVVDANQRPHDDTSACLEGASFCRAHGTAVASIIAGNGANSTLDEPDAAPFLLRGVAPRASLLDFDLGFDITKVVEGQASGMLVENHSHSGDGSAYSTSHFIDQVINRPTAAPNGTQTSEAVVVYSAGNCGDTCGPGCTQRGYFGVNLQAKNPIVVGASRVGGLQRYSALGPTYDGRIKPDLVAPGGWKAVKNDGDSYEAEPEQWSRYYRDGAQGLFGGTSSAAPAVTGTIALMAERYLSQGTQPAGWPLDNATYKAILVETADDVGLDFDVTGGSNPDTGGSVPTKRGPDFATGWGVVNTARAVGAIASGPSPRFATGELQPGESRTYFLMHTGSGRPKVTLAWDDVEAPEALGCVQAMERKLQNDLDLRLFAPDGTEHLPWTAKAPTPSCAATCPATSDDSISQADLLAQLIPTVGNDDVNNVEQVLANALDDGPLDELAGVWKVTVTYSSSVGGEAQRYAVAANGALLDDPAQLIPADIELGTVTSQVNPGNLVEFEAEVKNSGSQAVGDFAVAFDVLSPEGNVIATATTRVDALAAGAATSVGGVVQVSVPSSQLVAAQGRVTVDAEDVITEFDESNNVDWIDVGWPDLAVELVGFDPPFAPISANPTSQVSGWVRNFGPGGAGASKAIVSVDSLSQPTWFDVPTLVDGNQSPLTKLLSFSASVPKQVGPNGQEYYEHEVWMVANVNGVVTEAAGNRPNGIKVPFVVTNDAPPTAAIVAQSSFLYTSEASIPVTETLGIKGVVDDPDYDPLEFQWSVKGPCTIAPPVESDGFNPTTLVTSMTCNVRSQFALPLYCMAGGGLSQTKVVDLKLAVSDGVLGAEAHKAIQFKAQLPQLPVSFNGCADAMFQDFEIQDQLPYLLDPLCPLVYPNPDGSGPCQGLPLIWEILRGDIDPIPMSRVARIISRLETDERWVPSELLGLALEELEAMRRRPTASDGRVAALVLQRALMRDAAGQMLPVRYHARRAASEVVGLGWAVEIDASGLAGEFVLQPMDFPGVIPRGMRLDLGTLPMAVSGGTLRGGTHLSYQAGSPGRRRLMGLTGRGEVVDLTSHSDPSGVVRGELRAGIWGVFVVLG